MSKEIFVMGNVVKDKTIKLDKEYKPNTKERFYGSQSNIGGPAATAGVVCAKYGDEVTFAGTVGDDQDGIECKKTLNTYNINTDYVVTLYNYETPNSFVIVAPCGDICGRTIFSGRDKKDLVTPPRIGDINYNCWVDGFLTDGQYPIEAKAFVDAHPETISVIDAGRATPEIMNLCSSINYVICSEEFAQNALGIKDKVDVKDYTLIKRIYNQLYEKLQLTAKNTLVITLGAEGCYFGNNKFMSAYNACQPIDTTGAGDIFHGAFMHGILEYKDLLAALNFATIVAGLSTGKMGGIPSIPDLATIEQHLSPIANHPSNNLSLNKKP